MGKRKADAAVAELRKYASTGKQTEALDAWEKYGTTAKAAKALGILENTLKSRLHQVRVGASRRGWSPEHDSTHPTAPGYVVKGHSTLYGEDGTVKAQWVKTREDWAEQLEAVREALTDMLKPMARSKARKAPRNLDKDTFTLYPEGDPHWGMRVWGPETDGANYDLSIQLQQYTQATDALVDAAPASDTAVLLNVGDNFHSDVPENKTRKSGNHLNVDGRMAKVFRTVLEARRYRIDSMLRKHREVHVREVYGNHDEVLTMAFTEALKGYYSKEPRVIIHDSPSTFWYWQHGKVLIGATHGDKAKLRDLPLLMATDKPKAWGDTEHRHLYIGHFHHMERWEEPGCVIEMLRTMAARNEYEHGYGYRSKRDVMCRVYHKEFGEILTHRFTPAMFSVHEADY